MVEYLISQERYSYYVPSSDVIYIGDLDNGILSDNEFNEMMSDILIHEYTHKVLFDMFDITVCKLFDSVSHLIRDKPLIEKALLGNKELHQITHHAYILEYGFSQFLERYHITPDEIRTATARCKER